MRNCNMINEVDMSCNGYACKYFEEIPYIWNYKGRKTFFVNSWVLSADKF